MNKKLPVLFALGGGISAVCLGAFCFGDSFVTGLVVILLIFALALAWPLTVAAGLSIRFRKTSLIRALVGADRWTQDVVLAGLAPETQTECLRRLGRHGS